MTPILNMCDFCVTRIREGEIQRKTPNKKLTAADIITAASIVLIVSPSLSIDSLQLLCYLVVSFIRNLAILIAFFISSHNVQRDEHVNDDTVPYISTRIMWCILCMYLVGQCMAYIAPNELQNERHTHTNTHRRW